MTAVQHLEDLGVPYDLVEYGRVRSAEEAAAARGITLRQLVKSLVVRRGDDDYLFVLIAGDTAIDWPKLRSVLGVRRVTMPSPEEAKEATGYERGTITPLGALRAWPVVADVRVAENEIISIGTGRHGRAVNVQSAHLLEALEATVADIAAAPGGGGPAC